MTGRELTCQIRTARSPLRPFVYSLVLSLCQTITLWSVKNEKPQTSDLSRIMFGAVLGSIKTKTDNILATPVFATDFQ